MKIGSVILGFVMICIGIVALAGQIPVLGIHPVVWFILGILLICSDSAWEKLARAKKVKRDDHPKTGSGTEGEPENDKGSSPRVSEDPPSEHSKN